MKRRRQSSKSIFRAELTVQRRDDDSGLRIADRFFQPAAAQKPHHLFWILSNLLLLASLTLGLLRLMVTGFGIPTPDWLFPAVLLLCLAAAAMYQSEWCIRFWPVLTVILLLTYLGLLFFYQTEFLTGMQQLVNLAISKLNETYSGSLNRPYPVSGAGSIPYFLVFLVPPVVIWLSVAVIYSSIPLMMELLVFPTVAALLLFGAAEDTPGKFLLLFGVVLALSFARTKRQKRMWGGSNRSLVHENRLRFEGVQKKSALIALMLCILLSVPGFLLVQPLLAVSLQPARALSTNLQTDALNRVMKLLPNLTAGQWNLNVEAVSGGVQDGSISGETGYLLEGVEDLRLTLSQKPQNSLFLRGYVGINYENGSWKAGHAYTFDGAAINWKTDGSPRLFIQNLPFLRTTYALTPSDDLDEEASEMMMRYSCTPVTLFVERINANSGYTYVPYGAYLNDYYQIDAGDGAVNGQKEQEDRYFFFFREDLETILDAWNSIGETSNVLDRVEESYRAFCTAICSQVPIDAPELQEQIDAVKAENRWQASRDIDEITSWIRRYLAENYSYELVTPQIPEGEDPLHYFLFTTHRGNSVHFASAAVALYRMFGVPARYVVGYEIPSALFTVQAGGIYTATAQGDNSQAWAEIYVPGIGWSPRDMTPGVIGTLEEVGPGGIRVEVPDEETTDSEVPPSEAVDPLTEGDIVTEPDWEPKPDKPALTLEEIIRIIASIAVALLGLGFVIWLYRFVCRTFGLSLLRRRSGKQRLLGVFQAVYRRACRLKLPKSVDSQSEAFVTFLETELHSRHPAAESQVRDAVNSLYAALYGGTKVHPSDVRRMRSILLGLYRWRKKQ